MRPSESPPSALAEVDRWNYEVEHPFRGPQEIMELASSAPSEEGDLEEDISDEELASEGATAESIDWVPQEQQQSPATPPAANAVRQGQAVAWVAKVDPLVRKMFGRTGPSLVGPPRRVLFLNEDDFAKRFPEAHIVDVLAHRFLLPVSDQAGTPLQSILRHHHVSDQLLRDVRLVVRRLQALRTFVRERIAANAFVTTSPFGEVRYTPRKLVALLVGGFTTTEASRAARRVLMQLPADVEVLVHEALHFYAHAEFIAAIRGRARDRAFVGMPLDEILAEGVAEYFTRQVMRANEPTLGPIRVNAYQGYVEAASRFIDTAGENHARSAYFGGNTAAINRLFRAIDLNIRDYPLMVPDFMLQEFEEESPTEEADAFEYDGAEATQYPTSEAIGLEETEAEDAEMDSGSEAEDIAQEEDLAEWELEIEGQGEDAMEEEEEPERELEFAAFGQDQAQDEDEGEWGMTEYEAAPARSPQVALRARTAAPLNPKAPRIGRLPVAARRRAQTGARESEVGDAFAGPEMLLETPQARPDLGVTAKQVGAYDWAFTKERGERFRALVEWAAKEVGLNPGLVAENLIAEARRDVYLSKGPATSYNVGADDFYAKRRDIEAKVSAYKKVRWDPATKRAHDNDAKRPRKVVTVDFKSGPAALLGNAVYVKHGEEVLRTAAKAAGKDFDALPVEVRFALVRIAMNAGHGRALKNLTDALEGREVLIRKPMKVAGPQRNATIHAARAMHLSKSVFGVALR
jgi:hypothetical protein